MKLLKKLLLVSIAAAGLCPAAAPINAYFSFSQARQFLLKTGVWQSQTDSSNIIQLNSLNPEYSYTLSNPSKYLLLKYRLQSTEIHPGFDVPAVIIFYDQQPIHAFLPIADSGWQELYLPLFLYPDHSPEFKIILKENPDLQNPTVLDLEMIGPKDSIPFISQLPTNLNFELVHHQTNEAIVALSFPDEAGLVKLSFYALNSRGERTKISDWFNLETDLQAIFLSGQNPILHQIDLNQLPEGTIEIQAELIDLVGERQFATMSISS